MAQYRISVGHNIALLSLANIVPQPRTIGLEFARRSYAASGKVIDEMPHVSLQWDVLEDAAQYEALLAQFGLLSATTADVTVYVQDENYSWIRRNGKAIRPLIGTDGSRSNFFLRGFTILVTKLRVPA